MRTKVLMGKGHRMVRIGFGQNDGRWFFRIDLWWVGWRWTKDSSH